MTENEQEQQPAKVLRYTIDRFEDNGWAVLERDDGLTFNVPAVWLPDKALEGHVLTLTLDAADDGIESSLVFIVDEEATNAALETSKRLLQRLWEKSKDPGGDLDL